MAFDHTCEKTRVQNICGATRSFGYLPPHGKRLINGEEYSFEGDIFQLVAKNKRLRTALQKDLLDGRLAVQMTPAAHYYDVSRDTVQILGIDNGAVTINEPCWGHYKSSISHTANP